MTPPPHVPTVAPKTGRSGRTTRWPRLLDPGEHALVDPPPPPRAARPRASKASDSRVSRLPSARIKRLRSRKRQKAQNAKAGIRLVTDIAVFKRSNHIAHQARPANERRVKFVDIAALRALEGEPNSASVGSWNWLRDKGHGPDPAAPRQSAHASNQELSPEDRPIVIGISLPPEDEGSREISPQTATISALQTPHEPHAQIKATAAGVAIPAWGVNPSSLDVDAQAQKSVWSPDTPDTAHSFNSRVASSVYSQAAMPASAADEKAPPVPALPASYKKTPQQRLVSLGPGGGHEDGDESETPCTPFEEDGGSTPQKRTLGKGLGISPDSANSRVQGWWDHVVTPFMDKRLSFSSRKFKSESPWEEDKSRWSDRGIPGNSAADPSATKAPLGPDQSTVREPTPPRTPPSRSSWPAAEASDAQSSRAALPAAGEAVAEKHYMAAAGHVHRDQPPPYSPPKKQRGVPVRYRAVFPPGHPLHAQFPPSPGPDSPGLAATMTSQGAMPMTNIPPPSVGVPLPTRPPGTYLPQDHAHAASGRAHRVERQRRRYEKEDVVARRLGGFWRGRGFVPAAGCFGRSGREGRKRRRVWLAIWAAIILLVVAMVVLVVMLTRHHGPYEAHSIWVNLTDFPPMPTGVLTVVGPDNTASKSVCTEPSTLWSCSLPKDQHDAVAPYRESQPMVVMQIQWDNGTQNVWNASEAVDGPGRADGPRRGLGGASAASAVVRERRAMGGFEPEPRAADWREMWFLGNTTDHVQSERKAGEPTPFYISLLKSVNDAVKAPTLTRRGPGTQIGNESLAHLLPAPDLEADGTPSPAVMLPNPVQQPVRLFDRGLPTEHYGFYTHFKRTLFLKSVTILNKTADGDVPLDEDGGCRKNEADYLVTWGEMRVLVQIWTRALELKTGSLLGPDGSRGIGGTGELVRPGTMPYPVTVTLDTHGGPPSKKLAWDWPVDKRQKADVNRPELLVNKMGIGGTWINLRGTGDGKMGGFDGGTGGCKCEWMNWVKGA